MTRKELEGELYDLSFYSSMNQAYHQKMMGRYGWYDSRTKYVIGLVTCLGFAISAYSLGSGPPDTGIDWLSVAGVAMGFVSLVWAVVLNISPADAREQEHAQLFARWTDFHRDVSALEMQAKLLSDSELDQIAERLPDFVNRRSYIELNEPPADETLLAECEGDENQRRWGVRTFNEVKVAKANRERERQAAQSVASV